MYDRVLIEFLSYINNFKDFDYILALIKSTVAPTNNLVLLQVIIWIYCGKDLLKHVLMK